jgi:uncharacterized damage-inducible protein DinB
MDLKQFIVSSMTENRDYVARAVEGLTLDELAFRPERHSNSIIFLLWHLARVEDIWINRVLKGGPELYQADGWYAKFGTAPQDMGYGFDADKLDEWPVPSLALAKAYADAVRPATLAYLKDLDLSKLDTKLLHHGNEMTVGGALAHLVTEIGEHSGQIGYLRGLQRGIEQAPRAGRR